jgi:Putative restriction endonuclease
MDPSRVQELLKFPTQPVSPAPDICVEILSSSNTKAEIDQKRTLYFLAGAREVWICDRSNQIYFFGPDGPLDQSALCPQFHSRISLSAKTSTKTPLPSSPPAPGGAPRSRSIQKINLAGAPALETPPLFSACHDVNPATRHFDPYRIVQKISHESIKL